MFTPAAWAARLKNVSKNLTKNKIMKITLKNENQLTATLAKITEIIEAKKAAGGDAYLWLNENAGDCMLWLDEVSSSGDDGTNALESWTLTPEDVAALEDADTESDTIIIDGRN